jgi:hypothetical protein
VPSEQPPPGSSLEPFKEVGMPGTNMSHSESMETLYYDNGSNAFYQVSATKMPLKMMQRRFADLTVTNLIHKLKQN